MTVPTTFCAAGVVRGLVAVNVRALVLTEKLAEEPAPLELLLELEVPLELPELLLELEVPPELPELPELLLELLELLLLVPTSLEPLPPPHPASCMVAATSKDRISSEEIRRVAVMLCPYVGPSRQNADVRPMRIAS